MNSTEAVKTYNPTTKIYEFQSLHNLTSTSYYLSYCSYPNECEMGAHCGFHLHFMLSIFFHVLIGQLGNSSEEMSTQVQYAFCKLGSLLLNFKDSLYILHRSPLSDT